MAGDSEEKDGEKPFVAEPEIPLGELEARLDRDDTSAVSEEALTLEALDAFAPVRQAIDEEQFEVAESLLEMHEERGAEWYYQRAMLFKKRSWFLESLRNMKEAVRLDPENERYQQELNELDKMATPEGQEGKKGKKHKRHMGGNSSCWDGCCIGCGDGCGECCCACACQGICEGICNGC